MPRTERQAVRIQPFVAPCRYVVGETRVPGFLTDISTRGCRVQTDADPPAKGTALAIEVRLARKPTHLRIPGTVRWARTSPRGGFVFGVSFEGIGPDAQHVVDDVVEEFRRRAASIG
jgi:hypothetical protein